MSIYPSERDYLAEEIAEAKLEAKLERIEDARIEAKQDYKGFGEHLQAAEEAGIPIDTSYLISLAKMYGTPIPNSKEWYDLKISQSTDDDLPF